MRYRNKQFLASGVSILGLSGLSAVTWILDKHKDYPDLEMSIQLIFALLFASIFGTISVVILVFKRPSRDLGYWHNFIGILNFFVGVLLGLSLYKDGVEVVSLWYLWALLSFTIGIIILIRIYGHRVLGE